jgi:hypothetical protein
MVIISQCENEKNGTLHLFNAISKKKLTSFDLIGSNKFGLQNDGVCAYNNDILMVSGGEFLTYRLNPSSGYSSHLVNLHISEFEIEGMECLSDERVILYSERKSIILDGDDILKQRFSPNRFLHIGDKRYTETGFHKLYEFGNRLL